MKLTTGRCAMTILMVLLPSCEEDPFITNLDDAPLQHREASTTSFQFKTYQIPPTLGGLHSLYVGRNGQFDGSRTLVEFESHTILSWTSLDIDSGYFQFTLDSAYSTEIPVNGGITMGYFRRDSNYAELESNFANVDWINEEYPKISSRFVSDTSGLTHLQFPIDSSLVRTLSDTTEGSWLYLLESSQNPDYMLRFYSANSPVNNPMLRILMHERPSESDTSGTVVDTTRDFRGQSDVTLFVPPSLDSGLFDSTFSYSGVATGLVTIVKADLAAMAVPKTAAVGRAKLSLPIDENGSSAGSLDSLFFQAYALEDTITNWQWGEVLTEDIYAHHSATTARSLSASPRGSLLKLDVTELVQSLISERKIDDKTIANLGFKLRLINSGSIFDYAAIRGDSTALGRPLLEVFYEIP